MRNLQFMLLLVSSSLLLWKCSSNTEQQSIDYGSETTQMRKISRTNHSPYAMFGDSSMVLMTEFERNNEHILEIENLNHEKVRKVIIDWVKGMVKELDKNGSVIGTMFIEPQAIGRFLTTDPLAEKYVDISPYAYVANNPLIFIDPDGREIWIAYGENKVKYDNGKLYNEAGDEVNVDDVNNQFVSTVFGYLNKIGEVENGATVLGELSSSESIFSFTNEKVGGQASMMFQPNEGDKGGTIYAAFLMTENNRVAENVWEGAKIDGLSNELFHGYQQIHGETGADLNMEVASYLFSRSMTKGLGYDDYMSLAPIGDPNTKKGQAFNEQFDQLMNSQTFDPKLYQSTVKLFPKSGRIGQAYASRGLPLNAKKKNVAISRLFPLVK